MLLLVGMIIAVLVLLTIALFVESSERKAQLDHLGWRVHMLEYDLHIAKGWIFEIQERLPEQQETKKLSRRRPPERVAVLC